MLPGVPGDSAERADRNVGLPDLPRRRGFLRRRLDEHWPLTLYFYLYPLWWVLGLANIILFVLAVPLLWKLLGVRSIRVPQGFGAYALFLLWVLLGVTVLWVTVPGTAEKSGAGPLMGFAFRSMWYVSITIVSLYVLNASRTTLPLVRVARMLGYLFVLTVIGGLIGITVPNLDFPSFLELFLPKSFTNQEFMNALFHPRISQTTEFLGFEQPRVVAPYSFSNTWGNAFGLLLPFFVYSWCGRTGGWRRYAGPVVLAVSMVPVVYSLNRGLWLGLVVSLVWVVGRRLVAGDIRALLGGLAAVVAVVVLLLSTPLGALISTRVGTPHSDARREDTAGAVVKTTLDSSPFVGHGGTRQMVGNFNSLAGGSTPGCHQCAAPPLGTQGFLWGLIFMTGFVGAALMLFFLVKQAYLNTRRSTALGLLASTVIVSSLFYFLFYDSLGVPLLTTMIAIGISARDHAPVPRRLVGAGADPVDTPVTGEIPEPAR